MHHKKLNPSNTYFTSDLHLFHRNICRGVSKWDSLDGCRDFSSVEEMNEQIIKSINDVVGVNDHLFHLGDFTFQGAKTPKLARLRIKCGNMYHVFGNHCYNIRGINENERLFDWVGDYAEVVAEGEPNLLVCLSHYPMRSWNDQKKNSIHLHGHCHGKIPQLGRSLDMGWDVWKRPVSLEEIIENLKDMEPHMEGHH